MQGFKDIRGQRSAPSLPFHEMSSRDHLLRSFALSCLLAGLFAIRPSTLAESETQSQSSTDKALHADDWTQDAPGRRHKFAAEDLPPPYATRSANNDPRIVRPPPDARLQVPNGFSIREYARGFSNPRFLLTAPNGDVFVTESHSDAIKVVRVSGENSAPTIETFADRGMNDPFGIAFYPPGSEPQFLYVANTNGVIRFPYRNGETKARGPAQKLNAELSGGGLLHGGGHWTRDIVFSPDVKKMYVSVGSLSNVSDTAVEANRARIFEFNPEGSERKVFAWGIRNAVGIGFRPGTEELWMSTNERDGLGDDLVPDYIGRVQPGGFYGWPWFYLGNHQDPR